MKKEEEEPIKYRVFSLRLNDETIEELRERHKKSGLSWNLFILELLKGK